MTDSLLGLAGLLAITGVVGMLIGALLAVPAARFMISDTHSPALRCRRIERIAFLPLVTSLLAIVALVLPALFKLAGLIDDHCLAHGLHHPHLCLRHMPAFDAGPLAVTLMILGAWPLAGLARAAFDQYRQARLATAIARIAPEGRRLLRTEADSPRAYLLGIRRPTIVLTDGLLRLLTPAERRAVVHHEIAHARNGDAARRLLLGLLMPLHLPPTRRRLMRQWRQAVEERADDAVAARGQALDLASALIRILRIGAPKRPMAAVSMGADSADIGLRIRRLAGGAREQPESVWLERSLIAALGLAALAVAGKHHVAETFIGWLAG